MNFSYIVESLLQPPQVEPIQPIPCELDEKWINFETELGRFKDEFAQARVDMARLTYDLNRKKEEVNILKMMIENINSQGLKDKLDDMIYKYESEEGIVALTQQCREATGKVDAMQKVLMDTNADRYAKFTCFVCMDRLVDLFIEPCGHVICERCWMRTQKVHSDFGAVVAHRIVAPLVGCSNHPSQT